MKKPLKIVLIVVAVLLVLLIAAGLFLPGLIAGVVYDEFFGSRFTSYDPLTWDISDFDALQHERYTFPSDKGQMLTGYRYYHEGVETGGVVVIAHGFGGGGHRDYMNVADYFAANGYTVFAYDATGNDESEGEAVGGLSQGVIDLDYALRFIKSEPDFAGLPIMLWGHSWGGYSVGSVLALHPDVKAAVIVAGFNESLDMLEYQGRSIAGDALDYILPALTAHEKKLFGDYSTMSVLDGVAATDAHVMFIHSADDSTIPIGMSFDRYHAAYGDDPRFTFIRFEDRGHNYIYCDPARKAYVNAYNAEASAYTAEHDSLNDADRTAYHETHFDIHAAYPLDMDVMAQMLAHYDSALD